MTIAAGTKLDHYVIVRAIGAGGMGEVYRARDDRLARDVAVKVLPVQARDDKDRLQRFEREARAAGSLNHPGIVTAFDFGIHEGSPYLVTELLEGATIRDTLRAGPLPVRKAVDYAAQIAKALAAAHDAGVVHRDLKPANLFVTREGQVKILDFGIAKIIEPAGHASTLTADGTDTGAVLGTAGYMAPEQVRGQEADHRADVFAFGVVLYEMLSGRAPFSKDTPVDRAIATLNDEAPPLPDVPPALDLILRRCLEKAPERRFQSTRDLGFAIEALSTLSGSGATASLALRPQPRARWPYVLGAAALVALAGTFLAGRATATGARSVAKPALPVDPPKPLPLKFTRVSYRDGFIGTARFAPDEKTVLFSARFDGSDRYRTYSAVPGNLEPRILIDRPLALLDVSRTGDVALLDVSPAQRLSGARVLMRMPLAGGEPRALLESFDQAAWGTGGTLAITRRSGGKSRIELRDATDHTSVLLETSDELVGPIVSPDGKSIAVLRAVAFDRRPAAIDVCDLGGKCRTILAPSDRVESLAWRDDHEIWFTTERQVRAVTLDGVDRLITEMPGYVRIAAIARDGRVLMMSDDDTHRYVSRRGTISRNLTWQHISVDLKLSDDGERVVFAEAVVADDRYQVYLRPTDGGPAVHLGVGTPFALSSDHTYALIGGEPPITTLDLVPTGPGEPVRIPLGPIAEVDCADFLHDGKQLLIGGHEAGKPTRLWLTDRSGTAIPRPVGPEGLRCAGKPSPDDTRAIAKDDANHAFVVTLDGTTPPRPLSPAIRDVAGTWSSDKRSIYTLDLDLRPEAESPQVVVSKLDIETGRSTPWLRLDGLHAEDNNFVDDFEVTADGATYVYGYSHKNQKLYLVEGLR